MKNIPLIYAETDRLLLRQLTLSDVKDFLEYRSDEAVAKYQGWDIISDEKEAYDYLEAYSKNKPGVMGEWATIGIELKSDNKLIGDLGIKTHQFSTEHGEIGFTIARNFWQKGYGKEAVTALINYAFTELKMHRITGVSNVANVASQKLMEAIGMRREGHFTKNIWFKGDWKDEYLYAILEEEWGKFKGE